MDFLTPTQNSILEQLHPELRERIERVLMQLSGRLVPLCGHRDPHVQLERYKVGRIVKLAEDGLTVLSSTRTGGRIVTKALPMQSPHNYDPALAVDCVLDPDRVMVGPHPENPRLPNLWETRAKYTEATKAWADYGAAVRAAGLVWGGDFKGLKDLPHAEMPRWKRLIASPSA